MVPCVVLSCTQNNNSKVIVPQLKVDRLQIHNMVQGRLMKLCRRYICMFRCTVIS